MTENQRKIWDSYLPFYSQWYWQTAILYPYNRTKVYYHGPREKWMKLYETRSKNLPSQSKKKKDN
jgi:hypothetical protein